MSCQKLKSLLYILGTIPIIVGIVFASISMGNENISVQFLPYNVTTETSVVTNTTSFIAGPVNCTYGNYSMDDYPVCIGDMSYLNLGDKCIVQGTNCVEYVQFNCTKSYWCNLMCPMELLKPDCVIALSQQNCNLKVVDSSIYRGGVGYHTSSAFECENPVKNSTYTNYICGLCGTPNEQISGSLGDYYDVAGNTKEIQQCQSVCTMIEQNKVCQPIVLLVYNFVKSKEFTVCGYLNITQVNKTCVYDDNECISDFTASDQTTIYYSDCTNIFFTKPTTTTTNTNTAYIYVIVLVITFLFMTLLFCIGPKKSLEANTVTVNVNTTRPTDTAGSASSFPLPTPSSQVATFSVVSV
ncbi:MAG: hypothetical protein Hyperionvirus4_26 [Hyperionvirus sp.]|uniref:Transmembrane protein n=1 Tax=Hyperionvirus sp. TaxID=2487770 RepID=A0A3G5AA31_9VIRU|nr:MAG: hypothetical protein Hyperionvirus4_26 [Hyperionvirus sp.]